MTSNVYQTCLYLYQTFSIPTIFVTGNNKILFEFPKSEPLSSKEGIAEDLVNMCDSQNNPDIFSFSPSYFWGRVSVKNTDDFIVIGPLPNSSFTNSKLNEDFFEKEYNFSEYRSLHSLMNLSSFNINTTISLISFIHYLINNEVVSVVDHFSYIDTSNDFTNDIYRRKTSSMVIKKENENRHNTYYLEKEMLSYIRKGNPNKLNNFLKNKVDLYSLRAGKMANSPLRQEKNIFLTTLTKVGNQAAIPGGMDVEDTYELIDAFAIECENSNSIEEINKLQYRMLLTFCENVKKVQKQLTVSVETQKIIDFINERTNLPISLDDIVTFSGKSKSYITKLFKKEVGTSVGSFIHAARMNESKDLLNYTEMTISEVANYLSFSSQSHFQNSFKKEYGITPNSYRNKKN